MSWSNVLDYMKITQFHDMARRLSQFGDTIHYGYSMNWVAEVYGVNLLDYYVGPNRV